MRALGGAAVTNITTRSPVAIQRHHAGQRRRRLLHKNGLPEVGTSTPRNAPRGNHLDAQRPLAQTQLTDEMRAGGMARSSRARWRAIDAGRHDHTHVGKRLKPYMERKAAADHYRRCGLRFRVPHETGRPRLCGWPALKRLPPKASGITATNLLGMGVLPLGNFLPGTHAQDNWN